MARLAWFETASGDSIESVFCQPFASWRFKYGVLLSCNVWYASELRKAAYSELSFCREGFFALASEKFFLSIGMFGSKPADLFCPIIVFLRAVLWNVTFRFLLPAAGVGSIVYSCGVTGLVFCPVIDSWEF